MNKYVEFVVCKHNDDINKYLFYAPGFANINAGEEVLVDTKFGEQRVTVIETCNALAGSDVEKTLRVLTGAKEKPLKRVIGKYQFSKFDYCDYKEDEANE